MFKFHKKLPKLEDDKFFVCYNKNEYGKYIQLNNIITLTEIIFNYSEPKSYSITLNNIRNIIISDENENKSGEEFYGRYIKLSIGYKIGEKDYDFNVYFDLFDKISTDYLTKLLSILKIKLSHEINIENESRLWDHTTNNYKTSIIKFYKPLNDYLDKTKYKNPTTINELQDEAISKITKELTTHEKQTVGGNKKIKKHRQKSRKKKRTTRMKHTRRRYKNRKLTK